MFVSELIRDLKKNKKEPFSGFEPETSSLPRMCSTTELKRQ